MKTKKMLLFPFFSFCIFLSRNEPDKKRSVDGPKTFLKDELRRTLQCCAKILFRDQKDSPRSAIVSCATPLHELRLGFLIRHGTAHSTLLFPRNFWKARPRPYRRGFLAIEASLKICRVSREEERF